MKLLPKESDVQAELKIENLANRIKQDAEFKAKSANVSRTVENTIFKTAESLDEVQIS